MEFALLGWPPNAPTLRLDYRAFSYAGKFVTSNAGVAVLREADAGASDWTPDRPLPDHLDADAFVDDVVAAAAFNADRADPDALRIRYVTVHVARRGEGLGPQLVRGTVAAAAERGFARARIAVNNPFAYEALYKSGFAFTGRETGVAELVLERPTGTPADPDRETYQDGLDRFRERDLSGAEERFLAEREGADPPETVAAEFALDRHADTR